MRRKLSRWVVVVAATLAAALPARPSFGVATSPLPLAGEEGTVTIAPFAIANASRRTSATLRPQPSPNIGQVLRLLRKARRSSQSLAISVVEFDARMITTSASSTAAALGRPTSRAITFVARPIPEFTP